MDEKDDHKFEASVDNLARDRLKENNWVAGEMAQQLRGLRALAVLPEDLGSIPSTHMVAHNCNSSSRGSDTLTPVRIK